MQYFINCYPPLVQLNALVQYRQQSVPVDGDEIRQIRTACKKYGVSISLGISERMGTGGATIFNSQVFIDTDGAVIGVHRKIQPTYTERYVWGQGDGATLTTFDTKAGYKIGGLCCWEHTINGARQALIDSNQHVHAAAWPSLSTMAGFESVADVQIESMMKTHALTAQVFVLCASNYVDESCLRWLRDNLGESGLVTAGGGWSAIIHPFCSVLAGPAVGDGEKLLLADIDLSQLEGVKVWVDGAGHSARPDILQFSVDRHVVWPDEKEATSFPSQISAAPLNARQDETSNDGSRSQGIPLASTQDAQ